MKKKGGGDFTFDFLRITVLDVQPRPGEVGCVRPLYLPER